MATTPTRKYMNDRTERGEPDECWRWTGDVNANRSDRPSCYGKNASRWMWILDHGEPPSGWHVEHTCENGWCVNPSHLNAVPASDNYARLRRTHCKNGHELTEENRLDAGATGYGESRRYKCRTCTIARETIRTARRKADRERQSSVEAATERGEP